MSQITESKFADVVTEVRKAGHLEYPVLAQFTGFLLSRIASSTDHPGLGWAEHHEQDGDRFLRRIWVGQAESVDEGVSFAYTKCYFENEDQFLLFLYFAARIKVACAGEISSLDICDSVCHVIECDLFLLRDQEGVSNEKLNSVKLKLLSAIGPMLSSFDALISP